MYGQETKKEFEERARRCRAALRKEVDKPFPESVQDLTIRRAGHMFDLVYAQITLYPVHVSLDDGREGWVYCLLERPGHPAFMAGMPNVSRAWAFLSSWTTRGGRPGGWDTGSGRSGMIARRKKRQKPDARF